jgi:hypothetical protein
MSTSYPPGQGSSTIPQVIMSGLPDGATEDAIFKHFEKLDKSIKLKNVTISKDNRTGASFNSARLKFFNSYDGICYS